MYQHHVWHRGAGSPARHRRRKYAVLVEHLGNRMSYVCGRGYESQRCGPGFRADLVGRSQKSRILCSCFVKRTNWWSSARSLFIRTLTELLQLRTNSNESTMAPHCPTCLHHHVIDVGLENASSASWESPRWPRIFCANTPPPRGVRTTTRRLRSRYRTLSSVERVPSLQRARPPGGLDCRSTRRASGAKCGQGRQGKRGLRAVTCEGTGSGPRFGFNPSRFASGRYLGDHRLPVPLPARGPARVNVFRVVMSHLRKHVARACLRRLGDRALFLLCRLSS
ncbi:hypothetical protein FKP32DRAFT_1088473 [Trametes sanguinea]|nr:hypothetical protein FKP32DRAFT_1088473 [Trametes sanguinea]